MLEFMDKYARIPDLILYLSVIMTSLSFSIFHTFHKFLSLANSNSEPYWAGIFISPTVQQITSVLA